MSAPPRYTKNVGVWGTLHGSESLLPQYQKSSILPESAPNIHVMQSDVRLVRELMDCGKALSKMQLISLSCRKPCRHFTSPGFSRTLFLRCRVDRVSAQFHLHSIKPQSPDGTPHLLLSLVEILMEWRMSRGCTLT